MVHRATILALVLAAPIALAGCIGDADEAVGEQSLEQPGDANASVDWARPLPDAITGLDEVGTVDGVEAGRGLVVHGDVAYVSGGNTGFYTVDVSTPEDPTVLARVQDQFSRDVDLLHYDDGRTVAVLAASGGGMVFVNVTDPERIEVVATVLGGEEANVHNLAVVPGTHLVYNSRSVGTPGVDIVDASDPTDPELVRVFNDLTCHDVTFWPEGDRAYCPGVRETQIWDVADPEQPEIVTRIYNPAIQIHHWAKVTDDGELLLIGDEFAGSTDAAAGCWAAEDLPMLAGTQSDPVGAVWFYDVSDETQPTPLGYVSAELPASQDQPTPCTAHFGGFVGDRDKVVVGWQAGGNYLVDFTDPSAPTIVDHVVPPGPTWEAAVANGWIFTGNVDHGMDVLTFAGS